MEESPSQSWLLCRFAAKMGYIGKRVALEVRERGDEITTVEETGEWLLREGIISEEQWLELRAQWRTVHDGTVAPSERTDTGQTASWERATVPARGPGKEAQLPDIPGYHVERELGRGGMGVVYRARQQNPSRWVALKVMLHSIYASEQARRRFTREVTAAASLQHPGVVPVYETGDHGGALYYTMEYVDGRTLRTYLAEEQPTLKERLELFRRICAVVQHAHARGLVHRDLKPPNIMVDEEGRARILDFGLAKFVADQKAREEEAIRLTQAGAVLGTYEYMSPEQASGQSDQVDERSDVYSLGVILFEMLTGKLPHPSNSRDPYAIVHDICTEEPVRPGSVDRRLRGDLETIILTCLEKDSARRYESVEALSEDIGRYLRIEPITARPASTFTRVGKFIRRRRLPLAIVGLAVLLLITTALALVPGLLRQFRMHRTLQALSRATSTGQRADALAGLAQLEWGARREEVLDALRQELDSDDRVVRAQAWRTIRTREPDRALAEALAVMRGPVGRGALLDALEVLEGTDWAPDNREVLDTLLDLLRGGDGEPIPRVQYLLAQRAATDWLLATLRDSSEARTRCLLIPCLAERKGPEVDSELTRLLAAPDPRVRRAAAETLGERLRSGVTGAGKLVQWIGDEHGRVREFAVRSARLVGPSPGLIRSLLERLQDAREDGIVRAEAAEALADVCARERWSILDYTDWEELSGLLMDELDPAVTAHLTRLIGSTGRAQASDLLCSKLSQVLAAPHLWREAAAALTREIGSLGLATEETRRSLLAVLEVSDSRLQLAAVEAMGELEVSPAEAGKWAEPIVRHLSHRDNQVREATLATLENLAAPEAIDEMLSEMEACADPYFQDRISVTLERLHSRLLIPFPEAAALIRSALITRTRPGPTLSERTLPVVVTADVREAPRELLVRAIRQNQDLLPQIGLLLEGSQAPVREGAARWLKELTGGLVDADHSGVREAQRQLRGRWAWDASRGVFVPEKR